MSVGSTRGRGRGVQATKDVERKRKRETASADELQEASGVTTTRCSSSITSDGEVHTLMVEGSFPLAFRYRIPFSREAPPAPLSYERVLHFDFFSRRLGFLLHPFVRGLTFFFGCQLHHLSPTGILHLANFITFCECYLGTAPHLDLFHHLFCIMPQMSGSTVRDLGGMSIQLRPSNQFFPVELPRSMGSWHKNWFYVSGLIDNLPVFYKSSPQRMNSWESLDELFDDTRLLVTATARMKGDGLKGIHIMQTWVECRVLPLQAERS